MKLLPAVDAEIFLALSTFVEGVLALILPGWMLRAPTIEQCPRIARRCSAVLTVFAHDYSPLLFVVY